MTSHILHVNASTHRRPTLMSRIARAVEQWEAKRIEHKLGYDRPAAETFARLYAPDAPRGARKSRRARQHLGA